MEKRNIFLVTIKVFIMISLITVLLTSVTAVVAVQKKVMGGSRIAMDDTGYTVYSRGWPQKFLTYTNFMIIGTTEANTSFNFRNFMIDMVVFFPVSALIYLSTKKLYMETKKRS